MTNFTNITDFYKAIHVENSTKVPIFESGSEAVDLGYKSDGLVDYSWYYNYLIDIQHPLIIQAGEYDMKDGAKGQEVWMKETLKNIPHWFWEDDR